MDKNGDGTLSKEEMIEGNCIFLNVLAYLNFGKSNEVAK